MEKVLQNDVIISVLSHVIDDSVNKCLLFIEIHT